MRLLTEATLRIGDSSLHPEYPSSSSKISVASDEGLETAVLGGKSGNASCF
jgi:hypothetical protein